MGTGQTINIMTLGGLALAVGVLVDEATVEIENIHTHMLPGVSRARAVVEACSRTAAARLLSMLCILAVFVPSFFMVGVGRQLFVPLSLAVGFSMIASYLLSSTLVPVFSTWLMREAHRGEEREGSSTLRFYERLSARGAAVPVAGGARRTWSRRRRPCRTAACRASARRLFPDANAPLLRLRLRAPAGTRIEQTERIVLRALDIDQARGGPGNVAITSDFIGVVPSSYPVNLIHLFTSGPQEAICRLRSNRPRRAAKRCGSDCGKPSARSAGVQVSFEAGDIVSQVMSFGSPTPIEVAVQGISLADDYAHRSEVADAARRNSIFCATCRSAQEIDFPTVDIAIDRERAGQFGLTMSDVVRSVVPATSSSRFTEPNYWRDPNSGNAFQIQVQLPQNRMQSAEQVGDHPGDARRASADAARGRGRRSSRAPCRA